MGGEIDPIPAWKETDRLKAVDAYEILDTPREEEFEDIVQMAARVCNVPISTITLIAEDRQWFKAEVGLGVRETPLDTSICSHAILQRGIFSVPDTTKDDRFCDNPIVTGDPKLRFYAGALLETSDGLPLGTMCILDYKPRTLTEDEALTLKALARQVMTLLDLRRANKNLEKAAAKFRALFDQSSIFAGIMSLDGVVLEVNKLAVEGCGYRAEEVLGRPFWDCPWWSGSQDVQEIIRSATKRSAGGLPYEKTLPYWIADGSERTVDFALHPIRNASGQVIFLYPTGVDVTDRQQALARAEFLSQLTQKLSTVSDPAEINRVATRELGQFLGASRCYFIQSVADGAQIRVLPDWFAPGEITLEGTYRTVDLGLPEQWEGLMRNSARIADLSTDPWAKDYSGRPQAMNIAGCIMVPFVHEGKWVASLGVASSQSRQWVPDEQALLEHAMARVWPLIERARAELALRESEERFRAMSDNIAPLAWMAHPDGMLFWYNKRWYDFTGATFETMKGDGWTKVHDPAHLPHVIESWKKALVDGQSWEDTFPLRGADGNYRWFLSRAFPIRDADGKIKLWFGVNTDITELREANAQLGDKATHLEALVQQRTQKLSETISELEAFSYSISHDMRAPLRAMIGYSDVLKEDFAPKLEAQAVDYLNRISNASRRMDHLIQDVLIFSRLSQQDVVLKPVDSDALIRDIIFSYPHLHPEKVTISIQSPLPLVKGSEALLTQCFSNLLENGAKFVAPGTKAHIEVWAESSQERVRLLFQDNGIGISEHNLTRIFDIFHRVGRDNAGTGIGLAIVRKAAERMGGAVGVQSELGKGSLFWLDLPAPLHE